MVTQTCAGLIRRRIAAIAFMTVIASAAALILFLISPSMDDASKQSPRKIQVTLGETVRDFMLLNGLSGEVGRADAPDADNYGIALDVIADTGPIIFGDHWIGRGAAPRSDPLRLVVTPRKPPPAICMTTSLLVFTHLLGHPNIFQAYS